MGARLTFLLQNLIMTSTSAEIPCSLISEFRWFAAHCTEQEICTVRETVDVLDLQTSRFWSD